MVITVSREAESGAEEIARLAAEREGLQVADRAILERIAQQEGTPVAHLSLFDETAPGTVEALIVEWRTSISQAVYLRRLVHILLLLEREDNMLVMGRGAAFVLTDPGTLHVRMVAPMPCRIALVMQRQGVSRTVAERVLLRSDAERAKFVRQAFGGDIESPAHYDLVVNTAELSAETAAEIISLAAERKSERRIAAATPDDFLSRMSRLRRRPRMPRVSEMTWERCQRRPLRPFAQ
jgi:cytidylate kinase